MPVLDRIEEHTWSNIEEFLRERPEHFGKWKQLHGYGADVKIDDVDPIAELKDSDCNEIARILDELYPDRYFVVGFDDTGQGSIVATEVGLPQKCIVGDLNLAIAKLKEVMEILDRINEPAVISVTESLWDDYEELKDVKEEMSEQE